MTQSAEYTDVETFIDRNFADFADYAQIQVYVAKIRVTKNLYVAFSFVKLLEHVFL